ncbi:MAG: hypothetical protein KKE20_00575 [Nanoarchaeota archaeon]|nr:hypothetical protein [Nanoarchaeota archaeon]
MIELNFGKSEFVMGSSPQATKDEPDMIINVPASGDLEGRVLCIGNSIPHLSKLQAKDQEYDAIVIVGEESYRQDFALERKTYLAWIPRRGEWVGIEYERWEESRPRNDERYSGPFALNDRCEEIISKIYQLPESWKNKVKITKTAPSELKRLSELYAESKGIKKDGTALSINFLKEGDDDNYAVDWNWGVPGKWTMSCKEYGLGHGWERGIKMDEDGRNALLDEFGLKGKSEILPLEVIGLKTPRELAELAGKNIAPYTRNEIHDQ